MSLGIYRIKQEPVPYDGELGDKEFDFLASFIDEKDGSYYVNVDTLNDITSNYRETEVELPEELVKFLQERVAEEGDFWFTIA